MKGWSSIVYPKNLCAQAEATVGIVCIMFPVVEESCHVKQLVIHKKEFVKLLQMN